MSKEELLAYFSLRVTMGIQPRPCYRDYWSSNEHLRSDVFPKIMSRDRFDHLTTRLHFSHLEDGEEVPEDRLWKLRPVIDALNTAFVETLVPDSHISIDESLWKFRGRLGFVTYNPSKRARFGLKVYKLSASIGPSAGYTVLSRIYTGQDRSDMPASTKVVLDLMEKSGCLGKGYTVYFDSWYCSPTLIHILQSKRTNAVGTVRVNRKWMPRDLTVSQRGDVDFRSSKTGMLALQWKDRSVVTMLSTVHTAQVDENGKPHVIKDYNFGMKGVDVGDQQSSYYHIPRRSRVWYRKIFFFYFDLVLVNALAVHRTLGGTMTQKDFRLQLAEELALEFRARAPATLIRTGRPPRSVRCQLQQREHSVESVPDGRRLRCRWCSARGVRKTTRTRCSDCFVGLCTYGCFEAWHAAA